MCVEAVFTKQFFTTLNSLQMEDGMRAVLHPFPLANGLVKYHPLGIEPGFVDRAVQTFIGEVGAVSMVPPSMVADVQQVLLGDNLLTAAKQVIHTNTGLYRSNITWQMQHLPFSCGSL